MQRLLRLIFFCLFFAGGLISCTTLPVREEAVPVEPEKREPEPRELITGAANVTEFTKLIYPEETSELKTPADRIKISVKPQPPESAKKEVRSYYAAYCETRRGQLSTDLPVSRIPENLPSHIKPPYSLRFKKKYDLPLSVLWCQDKEDVFFGVEMKDRTNGVDGPGLNVTIYTEGFVQKNRVRTSQKDMIAKIEEEIEKDKQEMLYSLGIIDMPTITLIAKVSRPDAEGHQQLELSIENRGRIPTQIRMDVTRKFIARDGKSYDILWEEGKNGALAKTTSSGKGCQLINRNTLFVVSSGSKCTLSAPLRLPNVVSQQPPDGMLSLDWFTFDMRRVSAYEVKTSSEVRLSR